MNELTLGVDLGGTKLAAALVANDGGVVVNRRRPTAPERGAEAVIHDIAALVREIQLQRRVPRTVRVGVGVAGQVDPLTGVVWNAPNLGWREIPLRERLEELLQLRVAVLNDVQAAAYGEWRYGAGKGAEDLLTILVGTGIGGGIVAGGQLFRGCTGSAGEVGHMAVQIGGPLCRCGNRGCLEALAGGWAIAQRAREAMSYDLHAGHTFLALSGGDVADVTAAVVARAAAQGDALATGILRDAAEALGAGAASLVNVLNPCVLVLGGGVVEGYPVLVEQVREAVAARSLPAAGRAVRVERARLGSQVGVIGAAAWAREGADEETDEHLPLAQTLADSSAGAAYG